MGESRIPQRVDGVDAPHHPIRLHTAACVVTVGKLDEKKEVVARCDIGIGLRLASQG